jgi:hypothetical protein
MSVHNNIKLNSLQTLVTKIRKIRKCIAIKEDGVRCGTEIKDSQHKTLCKSHRGGREKLIKSLVEQYNKLITIKDRTTILRNKSKLYFDSHIRQDGEDFIISQLKEQRERYIAMNIKDEEGEKKRTSMVQHYDQMIIEREIDAESVTWEDFDNLLNECEIMPYNLKIRLSDWVTLTQTMETTLDSNLPVLTLHTRWLELIYVD